MDATDVMMTVATAVEDDNWSRTCNSSISPQNPDSLSLSFAYNHNNSGILFSLIDRCVALRCGSLCFDSIERITIYIYI